MNGENTKSVGSGVAQVQDYVGKSAGEMAIAISKQNVTFLI
jgi:hypothetical protein